MLTVRIGPLTVWGLSPHQIRSLVGCSPNAPLQARREAEARDERRLYAVACRVEPMVTHPAPPQTRTCAMHAYGSSSKAAAARARMPLLHRPLACRGQGW